MSLASVVTVIMVERPPCLDFQPRESSYQGVDFVYCCVFYVRVMVILWYNSSLVIINDGEEAWVVHISFEISCFVVCT